MHGKNHKGVHVLSTGRLLALPLLQIHHSNQELREALFPACLMLLSSLFPEVSPRAGLVPSPQAACYPSSGL